MFEPGQKVVMVETNFTGKTGPKVGSMGFVSDMDFYYCGVRFHKLTWFRYGFGKPRMETHNFYLASTKKDARMFRARVWGKILPVCDRQNINDMSDEEFLCWMHSIFRVLQGDKNANSIRARVGIAKFHIRPGRFPWNKDADRRVYADYAVQMKTLYFKEMDRRMMGYYDSCKTSIARTYDKHGGMSAERMARGVVVERRWYWDNFVTFFWMVHSINFVGPKYLGLIHTNEYLWAIYSLWKQEVKIFG